MKTHLLPLFAVAALCGCCSSPSCEKTFPDTPVGRLAADLVRVPGQPYCVCKYEVTVGQWKYVMGTDLSKYKDDDAYPAHNLCWNDCDAFVKKVNELPETKAMGIRFRLPTEAEWETIAVLGKQDDPVKGLSKDASDAAKAWYWLNGEKKPHAVGLKAPNALGVYDLQGNVWEWTATTYDNAYQYVLKGGGWQGAVIPHGNKIQHHPPFKGQCFGFRLLGEPL